MTARKTQDQFIAEARAVHGERYDYSRAVYAGNNIKVEIACPDHGLFSQIPAAHIKGQGCRHCGRVSTTAKQTKSNAQFLNEIKKIHGEKYDTSLAKYVQSHHPVTIICKDHGAFNITPTNLLSGIGCKKCSYVYRSNKKTKPITDFFSELAIVHGTKYGTNKIVFKNRKTKITMICNEHGDFSMIPEKLLSGQNCPKCADYGGKRNVIYLWGDTEGSDIYKIGISSDHLGYTRINYVAENARINPDIIRHKQVNYAPPIESKLLKLGQPVQFDNPFDGHTEFRRLTPDELRLALEIIDQAA
jgi:hypothetical protein